MRSSSEDHSRYAERTAKMNTDKEIFVDLMQARAAAPARLLTDHMLYLRRQYNIQNGRSLSDLALLDISYVCSIINQFIISYELILLQQN